MYTRLMTRIWLKEHKCLQWRILDSLPASSVILIMAVPCGPIIARAEGLDRTAVSISVPSTVSSGRLMKSTVRTVSPGWKVTTWLVIGV